jgi:DNA-binding NtrC family response regulator
MSREVIPPAARRSTNINILIVDDDPSIGEFLQQLIDEETPYRSEHVLSAEAALQRIDEIHHDLILLDYRLPGMDGLELYDMLEKREGRRVPVIMMSGMMPVEEAEKRHIFQLRKPMDIRSVIRMITHALATYEEKELPSNTGY